jgi:hypothetical protein
LIQIIVIPAIEKYCPARFGGHTLIFTILIYLHILHKTLTDFEFIRLQNLSIFGISFKEPQFTGVGDKDKFLLVKFRTSNHRLPIEVGRWRNIFFKYHLFLQIKLKENVAVL